MGNNALLSESPVRPGKSGLHASGEGERVIALESWEGNLASRRVEECLSRSFLGWGRNLRVPLISDSERRVPADMGQNSQAWSWVEAWNSASLSRCSRGERPLFELYLEPGGFLKENWVSCDRSLTIFPLLFDTLINAKKTLVHQVKMAVKVTGNYTPQIVCWGNGANPHY